MTNPEQLMFCSSCRKYDRRKHGTVDRGKFYCGGCGLPPQTEPLRPQAQGSAPKPKSQTPQSTQAPSGGVFVNPPRRAPNVEPSMSYTPVSSKPPTIDTGNRPLRTPCVRCGGTEGSFQVNGPHLEARCASCGAHAYFAPQRNKAPKAERRVGDMKEVAIFRELQRQYGEGLHDGNDFVQSLVEQYREHEGKLTPRQWEALSRAHQKKSRRG